MSLLLCLPWSRHRAHREGLHVLKEQTFSPNYLLGSLLTPPRDAFRPFVHIAAKSAATLRVPVRISQFVRAFSISLVGGNRWVFNLNSPFSTFSPNFDCMPRRVAGNDGRCMIRTACVMCVIVEIRSSADV